MMKKNRIKSKIIELGAPIYIPFFVAFYLAIGFLVRDIDGGITVFDYGYLGYFHIGFVPNDGLALSLYSGSDYLVLSGIQFAFLSFIAYFAYEKKSTDIAWSLVMAGGISNVSERLFDGFVTDYIWLGLLGQPSPIFNLADVSIFIGGLVIIYSLVINNTNNNNNKSET